MDILPLVSGGNSEPDDYHLPRKFAFGEQNVDDAENLPIEANTDGKQT